MTPPTPRAAAPSRFASLPASAAHRRYVALARLGRSGTWRAGFALFLVLGVEQLAGAVIFEPTDFWSDLGARSFAVGVLLANLAIIGSGWLGFALAGVLLLGRPLSTMLGADAALFWRGVLWGGGLIGATGLLSLAVGAAAGWPIAAQAPPPAFAAGLFGLGAALVILQAGAEELMFRGFIAQEIARRARHPLFWAVLPGAAFGLLHLDPTQPAAERWDFAISAALFAFAMSYATWRTGSLGFAIGYHVVNNWFALLIVAEPHPYAASLALFIRDPLAGGASTALELGALVALVAALEVPVSPVRRALGIGRLNQPPQSPVRSQ